MQRANLAAVIIPFVAFVAAIVLLWNSWVDAVDLAIFFFMYCLSGLGITVGFHRYFTHRSFQAVRPLQYAFVVAGSTAVQGPLLEWVADHRKHHAHTDEEGDPHSPHGHGDGLGGALRGLFHAHLGWTFNRPSLTETQRYVPELVEDKQLAWLSRQFHWIVTAGLVVPALVGFAIKGTAMGALTGLLWGGLVRVFLMHHATWSINSICHFFGRRRFETEDRSTNVFWLALPTFGESWHHNHHAFPRSSRHGLRWWEFDVGGIFIRGLEMLGLVKGAVRIAPERQQQKLVGREPAVALAGGDATGDRDAARPLALAAGAHHDPD